MKKSLIALVSVVVIVIVALLVVPSFFDWNQYKPQAVEAIKQKTGFDVTLKGDVKVALLPAPYAYINDVVVKSPKSKKYENLATLGRLDLRLAMAPLFSGKVDFTSVELVQPVINIETLEDGSQSWQTEEINALLEGEEADKAVVEQTNDAEGANMLSSISLDKVEISEGALALYNEKTQAEQVIDNIKAELNAETLSGPFTISGSVQNEGRAIKFTAKTGRIGGDSGSIPVNVNINVEPDNINISYSGVVESGESFEIQGETKLTIENLAETLSSFGVTSPVLKSASFNAQGLLTANAEGFSFQNSSMTLGDSRFTGDVGGKVNPFSIDIDMSSTQMNLGSAFDIPELANVRSASVSGSVAFNDGAVEAQNINLTLDETKITGDAVYMATANRPNLKLNLQSDNLDLNKFIKKPASENQAASNKISVGEGNVQKSLQEINLPLDMVVNADIKKGKYGEYSIDGLKINGSLSGNTVKIDTLSALNFAGSSFNIQGNVADYKSLNGVDITASFNTKDIKAFANALALDVSALPQNISALDLRAQAKGSAQSMEVTTNIKAMGGELIASGNVTEVLTAMNIGALDLQIKHSNFQQALNDLQPNAGLEDLNKPIDFYANVSKQNNNYVLSDIKGDISGISVAGSASIDASATKPRISGDLKLGDVVIGNKAAGGKAAAPVSGGNSAAQAPSGWSRQTLDSGWMNALNFDVKIAARSINYQGWDLAQPSLKAVLNDSVLTMEQLNAGLYKGQVNLQGTMKPSSSDKGYNINGKANLRDVSLEPLVGSLTGNRILTGTGLINTDVDVRAAGLSPSALVNDLNGSGTITGRDIVLTGFDLSRFARALSSETKPGDTALGIWKGATKGGSTQFDTLDGDFTINEGIVNITSVKLDGPKAYMDTVGQVNIPQFTITTKHSITLKEEDIPPFDINISGPLNNPGQTFGQGVLNDYISRKVSRKLEDLITDKLGDKLGLPGRPQQSPVNQEAPAPTGEIDGASAATDSVSDNTEAEQQPEQQQEDTDPAQEAIKGLLQGLMQ